MWGLRITCRQQHDDVEIGTRGPVSGDNTAGQHGPTSVREKLLDYRSGIYHRMMVHDGILRVSRAPGQAISGRCAGNGVVRLHTYEYIDAHIPRHSTRRESSGRRITYTHLPWLRRYPTSRHAAWHYPANARNL